MYVCIQDQKTQTPFASTSHTRRRTQTHIHIHTHTHPYNTNRTTFKTKLFERSPSTHSSWPSSPPGASFSAPNCK